MKNAAALTSPNAIARRTRSLLAQLESTERYIAGLREMLAVATGHGMDYHEERLAAEVREFEAEAEALMEDLAALGFTR